MWCDFYTRGKEKKMKAVSRFLRDERGTETVEWAIIIGVIAVGAIAFTVAIGGHVTNAFGRLSNALNTAGV